MTGNTFVQAITIVVKDMDVSAAFYRSVGIDIPESEIWRTESGGQHVSIELANGLHFDLDSQALTEHFDAGWSPRTSPGGGVILNIEMPSRDAVDEMFDTLVADGAPPSQAPFDAFWGARYAVVVDPDGNHVGLMSPVDKSFGSRPPDV